MYKRQGNTLHGGQEGFDAKLWTVREHTSQTVTLELLSPAGDEGFPGELTVTVTYALAGSRLSITTRTRTTAATPVSLTNHAYFSLNGQHPSLDGHWIQAVSYTHLNNAYQFTNKNAEIHKLPS